jgi:hypothetical protein
MGYAYRELPREVRRTTVELAQGTSETAPFVWHDAPGLAPPADLWVEAAGKPILQVSSVGTHPFARAGLDVVPLERDVPYRLRLERNNDGVDVTLVRDGRGGGAPVLHTRVHDGASRATESTPVAELVSPARPWRSSISVQ